MWDPPGPGIEPVSPELAGGLLTTAPLGKSPNSVVLNWGDGSLVLSASRRKARVAAKTFYNALDIMQQQNYRSPDFSMLRLRYPGLTKFFVLLLKVNARVVFFFFFPVFFRYNWHTALCKFKVYSIMIWLTHATVVLPLAGSAAITYCCIYNKVQISWPSIQAPPSEIEAPNITHTNIWVLCSPAKLNHLILLKLFHCCVTLEILLNLSEPQFPIY